MTKKIVYGFFLLETSVLLFLETYCRDCHLKKKKKNHCDKESPSTIKLKLESPQNSIKWSALLILLRERERERERERDEQQYIDSA